MKKSQVATFQQYILGWYVKYGRHELPWRATTDPYKILVSELMLQQTQVDRVIPKYLAFLQKFPTAKHLSATTVAEVLQLWQGLGYNRRAKFVWQTAQVIVTHREGVFPQTIQDLQRLPGIGPYTASAVSTFAFNNPETVIETNIRAVYIYHFFPGRTDVSDAELLPLITKSIYTSNPREWYAALMDYGTQLKKILPNPSRKSKHHTTQSRFKGSPRQVRGEIVRYLTQKECIAHDELQKKIRGNINYFPKVLQDLLNESLVEKHRSGYSLKR